MIPASLGALEGANVAIFAAFSVGGAVGLACRLVRRLREIVWIGAGFALLSLGTASSARSPVTVVRGEDYPRSISSWRVRVGHESAASHTATTQARSIASRRTSQR